MALTVGQLVAYLTLDDSEFRRGEQRAHQSMGQLGRDLTRTTTQAGQQAGQGLARGVGDGADDAARQAQQGLAGLAGPAGQAGREAGAEAGRGLSTGLGSAARQAGQDAGRELDGSLSDAARRAGSGAADQAGQGLDGLGGAARDAGADAGRQLDGSLTSAARQAGQRAGDRAGDALESEMEQAGEQAGEAGGESLADGLDAQTVGLAAVGGVLGLAFIGGFVKALDKERVTDRMNAQLGATGDGAKQYGKLAGELWKNAIVENVEDGAEVIRNIAQQGLIPPKATNAQLESIATKVADVSNLLDEEFGRTTMAVSSMLKNGLAKNAEQALDVLVTGMQKGVNKGEDLLDTFYEYSPFFAQLGIDAKTALGVLSQGLDRGAWHSDLLADALKEGLLLMQEMAPPAAEAIEKLGLNADDMRAAFNRGGPAARDALQKVFEGMRAIEDPVKRNAVSVALFGTKLEDTQSALYGLDLDTAADKFGDFSGAAEKAGITMRDNAATNIDKFKRSLESGVVEFIGGKVIPVLVDMAKFAQEMWDGVPEDGQGLIKVLGMLALGMVAVTTAFGLGRAAVQAYQTMLANLSAQATATSMVLRGLNLATGAIGVAIVAATVAMSLFGREKKKDTERTKELTDAIKADSGAIGDNTKENIRNKLSKEGVYEAAERLGLSLEDVRKAAEGDAEAWKRVRAQMESGSSSIENMRGEYDSMGKTLFDLTADHAKVAASLKVENQALVDGQREWERQNEAMGVSADQAHATAEAERKVTEAAEDQEKAIADLKEQWDEFNGKALDSMAAQDDLEASVDALTESIKENGRTLDSGTEKGRANRGAIRDMIEAAYDLSEATLEETGSREEANKVLETQRERLRKVLDQMGYTKTEIDGLIDKYYKIPKSVDTDINADAGDARAGVSAALNALARLPNSHTIRVTVAAAGVGAGVAAAMGMLRQADGGIVRFADGGVHSFAAGGVEDHTAQIARGGPIRIWAEPETHRESYIPWAPAKRARSTVILAETAKGFGFDLVPLHGQQRRYADGGIDGYSGGGGTAVLAAQRTGPLVEIRGDFVTTGTTPADVATELDWRMRVRG